MSYQPITDQIKHIKDWLRAGSINIFGTPLAGKDTQAQRLAELLGGKCISSGQILRSSSHETVKQIISGGRLAPTNDFLQIVLPFFSKPEFAGKPLILSSLGRWHGEEAAIMEAAEASGHPLKAVVFLQLPDDVVRQRLAATQTDTVRGQRADDSADILEIRFAEFRIKTLPVIEFYRNKGLLFEVNGNQTREIVTKTIIDALVSRASASR
jgi:adenylate kinase